MKKLLAATLFMVLAAMTETPDDYVVMGGGNAAQVDSYLSAWAQAEEEGFIAEDSDRTEPCSDVQTDQVAIDGDAILPI